MRKLMTLTLLLLACEHAPPEATPFVPAGQQPPPLVLNTLELQQTGTIDALLDGMTALGGETDVANLLENFLKHLDAQTLAHNPQARMLVAHAVVRLSHLPDFMERFDAVKKAVDLLMLQAPQSPEALFCRTYLRWVLLTEADGQLQLGTLEPEFARGLQKDLRRLVQLHPAWQGPGEFSARRLQVELARVDALLHTVLPTAMTETSL